MRNGLLGLALLTLVAGSAGVLSAEELSGQVTRVEGSEAFVELPSGAKPSAGDRVVIGWILEGLDEFVEARTGTVREVRAEGVVVDLAPGDAPVKAGYIAKVTIEEGSIRVIELPDGPGSEGLPDEERELSVIITLVRLGLVEGDWKAEDMDGNGLPDYWTRDVASLHYRAAEWGKVEAIEVEVARADKAGFAAYSQGEAVPHEGYWFSAIRMDASGRPYAQVPDAAGVPSTHPSAWALCAWPAKHGGSTRFTYIVDEKLVVYRKDRGAAGVDRVDAWPKGGPAAGGWTECEGIMITRPIEGEDHPRK